jgi:rhamnose utilization protein RhaD (predicted bifunctional aldolase and dehydrogenase)
MMKELKQLIELSRFYGGNPDFVIAGGGNTSFKNNDTIWIKASGISLAGIDEKGFVALSREKLSLIETESYSEDPVRREEEVKEQMGKAILSPVHLRPSVETSLHNLIPFRFVVHTHPTLVNALMCANEVFPEVEQRFGKQALMVEYTDPGYILFKKLQERVSSFKSEHGEAPRIIFLQNHGVFVGGDTPGEVKKIYADINRQIMQGKDLTLPSVEVSPNRTELTDSLAGYFAKRSLQTLSVQCELIKHFTKDKTVLRQISKPFTPDIIVYCKSKYLILERGVNARELSSLILRFEHTNGYYPKVIVQEGGGITVVEENEHSLKTVLEVFLDLMKISYISEKFGGPHFMEPDQIAFIDNWEVEHYRRKVAKGQ